MRDALARSAMVRPPLDALSFQKHPSNPPARSSRQKEKCSMRIHTDQNTWSNLYDAARVARVSFDRGESFNSSIRESGFDITLTGESRRRPNNHKGWGERSDEYAATWDQWGVFLGHLFNIDPDMVCGTPKHPVYASEADFEEQTDRRFVAGQWPEDAHGDHTFRWNGVPYERGCTKCSAVHRWSSRLAGV